jgi:hypothetical protein
MEQFCALCRQSFDVEDSKGVVAHLELEHPVPAGGFRFFFEGRIFFSNRASMLVLDIVALTGGSITNQVFEQRGGERFYLSHLSSVDLTHEPHLYICISATY